MNKPTNSTTKQASLSNSKSKKNSKDREKRKLQTEIGQQNSSEKSKDATCTRQYAGIGPESICIYTEQTALKHPSLEICNRISEDVNYHLRYVIHDALVRARLSGRNLITSRDIDETFQCLNIERVYGAPADPEWLPLDKQGLYFLDDKSVNLIELAEEEITYVQAGDSFVTTKWLPDTDDVSKELKNYFTIVCESIVDKDQTVRSTALNDIRQNTKIGPIIEWFYQFSYYLISYYLPFDHITLCAVDLIIALDRNPLSCLAVSEKQLNMLVRLILQRVLSYPCTPDILNASCFALELLSQCDVLKDVIVTKIAENMDTIQTNNPLPVLKIMRTLGIDTIEYLFLPNMVYFLNKATEEKDPDIVETIIAIYRIICKEEYDNNKISNAFHEIFGDKTLVCWKRYSNEHKGTEKLEKNWLNMKSGLLRTQRHIKVTPQSINQQNIQNVFQREQPIRLRLKYREAEEQQRLSNIHERNKQTHIILGKTNLLINELKSSRYNKMCNSNLKCFDHSLLAYNL